MSIATTFEEALASLRARHGRWRTPKKELPKEGKVVLLCFWTYDGGWVVEPGSFHKASRREGGSRYPKHWMISDDILDGTLHFDEVVCWRYLPAPPRWVDSLPIPEEDE